jgi:hypothetical protein
MVLFRSLVHGVFEWYARSQDGREKSRDIERRGRPTPVRTPDMIETVRALISTDRRMTLRMTKEELEIRRETIAKS